MWWMLNDKLTICVCASRFIKSLIDPYESSRPHRMAWLQSQWQFQILKTKFTHLNFSDQIVSVDQNKILMLGLAAHSIKCRDRNFAIQVLFLTINWLHNQRHTQDTSQIGARPSRRVDLQGSNPSKFHWYQVTISTNRIWRANYWAADRGRYWRGSCFSKKHFDLKI